MRTFPASSHFAAKQSKDFSFAVPKIVPYTDTANKTSATKTV